MTDDAKVVCWKCSNCGNNHIWLWEKWDVDSLTAGTIYMECDKCRKESPCVFESEAFYMVATTKKAKT